MDRWPQVPRGCHVGTGSGEHLRASELIRTGKVITGYELLEMFSTVVGGQEFHVQTWLDGFESELQAGAMIMVESPTLQNQYGRFRFNPQHPWNIDGHPQGCISGADDIVRAGLDPGHG
jgi:hypothetical protein